MKRLNNTTASLRVWGKIHVPIYLIIVSTIFQTSNNKIYGQSSIKFAGVDSLVDQAIDLVYHQKYFDAIAMCEKVIQKYPDNPMCYLGQAGVYHILMLNSRLSFFAPQFDSLTALAIKFGEKAVKKYRDDANAYFVLGGAYGFRGLNRIRNGQWFGAFTDGIKGVSNVKKAYEKDQTLYDVYYGLGLYYYWKSAKAKVLTFLRLMKDEREKGVEFLKIATEKGRFAAQEAVFALIEIYYYEDRYEEALTACLSLKEKFSRDTNWNYLTAKVYDKLSRWAEARQYYIELLHLLEESEFKANSFLAECHFGIAKSSFELGEYETAREELNRALELSKSWDNEKELEGPLLDFEKVLEHMKLLEQKIAKLDSNPAGSNEKF